MPEEKPQKSNNGGNKNEDTTLKNLNQEKSSTVDQTAPALEEVAAAMSAPNPDIEKLPKAEEPAVPEAHGKKFDPAIHEADAQGQPILTPTGRYKLKKGARASTLRIPESDNAEEKKNMQVAAQRRMAAFAIVQSFINTGIMVFGDEWIPEKLTVTDPQTQKVLGVVDEQEMLVGATETYMAAKNINDIPPGLALTIVVSSYCMKRATKPKTREKLAIIIGGIRGKIIGLWSKVKGVFKKRENGK